MIFQAINKILARFNVERQMTDSNDDIAYLCADIAGVDDLSAAEIWKNVTQTSSNVATRGSSILFLDRKGRF
jgi:D-3-phosphoglycerate dehydrogenase